MTPVRVFDSPEAYRSHLATASPRSAEVEAAVREILARVAAEGDAALLDYSERFDGGRPEPLRVPQPAIEQAVAYVDPAIKDVWIQAIDNIERFHRRQREAAVGGNAGQGAPRMAN